MIVRMSTANVQRQIGSDPEGRDSNRADHDFYRTSPQAVLPLFRVEKFPDVIDPIRGDDT